MDPGSQERQSELYKHKGASLFSCLCDRRRWCSTNEGPKPQAQTVPGDFTEGVDERHLGSSANLPLIIRASDTSWHHVGLTVPICSIPFTGSPGFSSGAQRGPRRLARQQGHWGTGSPSPQHPQSPDPTGHSASLSIHFMCEHIKRQI